MSLLVQFATILLIVAFSINFPDKRKLMTFGACSMLLANVLGQLIIVGEGPAFMVGFVIFPVWGILIAYIATIATQKYIQRRSGSTNG